MGVIPSRLLGDRADGNNTRRLEGAAPHADVVAKEDDGASERQPPAGTFDGRSEVEMFPAPGTAQSQMRTPGGPPLPKPPFLSRAIQPLSLAAMMARRLILSMIKDLYIIKAIRRNLRAKNASSLFGRSYE
jgi:hypothetical protein